MGPHTNTRAREDDTMLTVSWDIIRLFLHVLAATIWVGGQLVLAALVPVLRRFGADALGALTGISALAALFLGVLLAG